MEFAAAIAGPSYQTHPLAIDIQPKARESFLAVFHVSVSAMSENRPKISISPQS
jgi:hypothetical protein